MNTWENKPKNNWCIICYNNNCYIDVPGILNIWGNCWGRKKTKPGIRQFKKKILLTNKHDTCLLVRSFDSPHMEDEEARRWWWMTQRWAGQVVVLPGSWGPAGSHDEPEPQPSPGLPLQPFPPPAHWSTTHQAQEQWGPHGSDVPGHQVPAASPQWWKHQCCCHRQRRYLNTDKDQWTTCSAAQLQSILISASLDM